MIYRFTEGLGGRAIAGVVLLEDTAVRFTLYAVKVVRGHEDEQSFKKGSGLEQQPYHHCELQASRNKPVEGKKSLVDQLQGGQPGGKWNKPGRDDVKGGTRGFPGSRLRPET